MPYVTNHHVSHNGRDYAPDEEITFEDKDAAAREALLDCKAIREVEGRPAKAAKAPPVEAKRAQDAASAAAKE